MHTPYIVMLLTILELLYKDCLAFLVHVHLSASVRLPSISLQRISLVSSSIARQFPCRWLLVTAAPPRSTSVGPMSRANVPRLPGLALPTLTDVLALEICYSRRHDFESCSFLASLSAANVESPIYLPSAVFPFAVHLLSMQQSGGARSAAQISVHRAALCAPRTYTVTAVLPLCTPPRGARIEQLLRTLKRIIHFTCSSAYAALLRSAVLSHTRALSMICASVRVFTGIYSCAGRSTSAHRAHPSPSVHAPQRLAAEHLLLADAPRTYKRAHS